MRKICDIPQIGHFGSSESPVELWRCLTTGRRILRIPTEEATATAELDLEDVLSWVRSNPLELTHPENVRVGDERGLSLED